MTPLELFLFAAVTSLLASLPHYHASTAMSLPRVKGDGTVLPVHNEKQPAHATPDGSTSSNTVAADSAGRANGFKQLLNGDIDPAKALGPLLAYCFATGFTGSSELA